MEKLPRVKPWIIRDDDVTEIDGEYLQTPEELDAYKQFSMCINCMLCYAACPVYGLDPDFVGPAAIALAERYDLDSRDQGARERLDVLIEHEGVWGCTFVGECTARLPQARGPGRRHPALQAQGGPAVGEGVPAAAGRCDEPTHDRDAAAADLDLVVAAQAHLLPVRDARAEQHLRGLVRALPAAAHARGRPRARRRTRTSSTGRPRPWSSRINVVAFAFVVLHTVTWFGLTPQAMALRVARPAGAGVADHRRAVRRPRGRVRVRLVAGDPMTKRAASNPSCGWRSAVAG